MKLVKIDSPEWKEYQPGEKKMAQSAQKPQQFQKPTREQLEQRYTYHAPKGDQKERYESIRRMILDTALHCVSLTPCCPEQARALNALDEAMFLFNAAIARNE